MDKMEKETVSTEIMYEMELLIEEIENMKKDPEAVEQTAKVLIDKAYRRLTGKKEQTKLF
jgi:hypothetical protein